MSECPHCGLTTEEVEPDDIYIGLIGEGQGNSCTICRMDNLHENTVLSKQEAKIAAHKEITGASHEKIAERVGLSKSTVDEYSRRMKEKVRKAATTTSELERFL